VTPEPAPSTPSADLFHEIELVVFDKDGTLIDFDTMWSDWSVGLVKDVAAATDPALADPLADALGIDPLTSRIIPGSPMSGTPMGHLRALTMDTLRRHGFSEVVVETVVSEAWRPPDPVALAHPLADLGTLFETLHARGIRVAVATSDDRGPTEATIAGLDLAALVDGIVCADDGMPIKPAPDALLHLCGLLGVAPARTAIVGDSPADLLMGRAAGAGLVVGVLSGVGVHDELAPYADVILQSIAELIPE
jgi:phosphoglycolate phosphatase